MIQFRIFTTPFKKKKILNNTNSIIIIFFATCVKSRIIYKKKLTSNNDTSFKMDKINTNYFKISFNNILIHFCK